MRQDALTEQNARIWTSGQLGQVLDRHASEGLNADIPAPVETKPANISLAEELTGSSSELTDRGVQALMSGTRNGYGANTVFYEHPTYGDGREEEEKKKLDQFRNNHAFMNNMQTFNIGGIQMTAKEASTNLSLAQERLLKTQVANTEAARIDITKEEFKALSKVDDSCVIVDGRAIEDVTIVDGHFVDTNIYYEMEIQNQELAEQYTRAEEFTVQLEAGNVTWEQAPQDIVNLVAEEHKIQNEELDPEAPQEPQTILEQLEGMQADVQATMQPVTIVHPAVSFSQMTPG